MSKILPHKAEAIKQFAIEGIIKGYSNDTLIDLINADYGPVNIDECKLLIRQAHSIIKDETLIDIDKIIPQHIELYERLYRDFDNWRSIPGKLKAMRAKERLIGLHKESNYVDVYNEMNIEVETDSQYDLSRLTTQEQSKLNSLLKKIEDKNGTG